MTRNIKKAAIKIAVAAILAFVLIASAFAGNFEHLAEEMKDMGLFRGTDTGFELDRVPNRAEAVIMLIRLLGVEEDALEGDYEHPFTDVPDWADAHVAYAYENGLTTGTAATLFDPRTECSAQMFVTFMLRALGYSDLDGDFTYSDAIDFGKGVGIIDDFLADGPFLRDDMVAVAYLALGTAPNDGEFDTLLDKLVDEGAVPEAAAEPVLKKFALYDELSKVGSELDGEARLAMSATMSMDMGDFGSAQAAIGLIVIAEGDSVMAEIQTTMHMAGQEYVNEYYVADGYVYTIEDSVKQKKAADQADIDVDALINLSNARLIAATPIYAIKSIAKSPEDASTVYTIDLTEGYKSTVVNDVLGLMGDSGFDMAQVNGLDIEFDGLAAYAGSDGALEKIKMVMTIKMEMKMEGISLTLPMKATLEIKFLERGEGVIITLPDDLDEYVLVEP